jgi:beta-lactamase regulating signal transducer with metallopeptidase domain
MSVAAIGALWNGYVVLLHATVFLAGVALVLPLARRAGAEWRANACGAALIGMLLVSALCWLPIGWWARAIPAFASAPLLALGAAAFALRAGEPSAHGAATIARGLLALWLGGAAVVLVRLGVAWLTLRAVTRRAVPVHDREWSRALREACTTMGTDQGIELRVSHEVAAPLTWGVLDPVILLPGAAHAWPAERRRLVLLHELAHVRRGDGIVQAIAQLTCAWYWFHPGAWWARRELRDAREEACDARVLAAGVRPSAYAQALLEVAAEARGRAPGAALTLGMARGPRLHARIRRVLAASAPARSPVLPGWTPRAAVLAGVAWALLLGSVRLSPQRAVLWGALAADAWPERAYAAAVLGRSRFPQVRAELRARAANDPHPVVRRLVRTAR